MSENTKEKYLYTQNRELSWLRFNRRVLEEAADPKVPALEKLKFVSIFSSNLDEFFMVRVGSLFDIASMTPKDIDNKTGFTAEEQLQQIYNTVAELLKMKENIYSEVMEELEAVGVTDATIEELDDKEMKAVSRYFRNEVLPILSPILIGSNHPVPHLSNKCLYAAAFLENRKGQKAIGIVPVPKHLPAFIMMPDGRRFVRTENILMHRIPELFDAYTVRESCILCVTRNADISFDDEKFEDSEEDFRRHVSKLLKKRDHLAVVRLELSKYISEAFRNRLSAMVKIKKHQIFVDSCPLNMGYVFRLAEELPRELAYKLLYAQYKSRWPEDILRNEPVFSQIQKSDRLLSYPYDSVEPFLQLLNEAAEDPQVLSIKITIYRLASSSRIAQILCNAAKNGKEVLVLMELRARFDEENNLAWSKMLEDSGCQVIYGMEGFKCHSKICLITFRSRNRTGYITQIGTGNYNEKTNAMYTDLSLMTADMIIGEEAAAFFRNMLVNKLDGEYSQLCVSPLGIKRMLIEKINRQIDKGQDGFICIKVNSVTEREIIDRLMEASRAGVEVQLIVRGICCILPEVCGYTDNIRITSIVGRFLEHSRIYLFGRGDEAEVYISSADLMTRNLNRRVEIACPVHDPEIREQMKWLLNCQLKDTAKASDMLSDGSYCRRKSAEPFDSQLYFMQQSLHNSAVPVKRRAGIMKRIRNAIEKIFK